MRVDYDTIAHLYDERRRDHPPDRLLEEFLAEHRAGPATDACVLDVGCGTGKQLASNRARFGNMTLIGIDRSAGMLRIARAREPRVAWIQGDAQDLPLGSGTIAYATNQFSYPHIRDKTRFVSEIHRVLRPGGRFVLTNIDPWAMEQWIIYRYFPEARALDERDYLTKATLVKLLADTGFATIQTSTRDLSRDEDLAQFHAYAAQRHSASQFLALSDAAYEAGLGRVRDHLSAARAGVTVPSQFVILTISADKRT
jgi:ubiquinone/menaquinone biosynthesis C-methylase UbiE